MVNMCNKCEKNVYPNKKITNYQFLRKKSFVKNEA